MLWELQAPGNGLLCSPDFEDLRYDLLFVFFTIFFTDPAKILNITSSAVKSWIGQKVTLKCESDGVPTPTLTWYKPDGNELHAITAKEQYSGGVPK